jgi:hypothetical protein
MDTTISATPEEPKPKLTEPVALSGDSSKATEEDAEEDAEGIDAIRLDATAEATQATYQGLPNDEQAASSTLPPDAIANTSTVANPVEYNSTDAPDNDTVSVQGSVSEVASDVIDVDQNVSAQCRPVFEALSTFTESNTVGVRS